MPHRVLSTIHRTSAILAFSAILLFWTTTAASELFGNPGVVALVKKGILAGMLVLIPSIVAAGITGLRLGGKSRAPAAAAKRRRIPSSP